MNKINKVLIVEDDLDLQEILELLIQSHYNCEVTLANDGKHALQIIDNQKKFDLITSDFNMPNIKGDQLYSELRKFDKSTPFILISSEPLSKYEAFNNAIHLHHLDKPFADNDLVAVIQKALEHQEPSSNQEYIPIRLSVLFKFEEFHFPIFIKIAENHFVKILNNEDVFDENQKRRFENKNVELLYLKKYDFQQFIRIYSKTVFSKIAWSELDGLEITKTLGLDLDLILKSSQVFGWSPEIIEMSNKNIAKVIQLAEQNLQFQKVVEIFKTEKSIRLATHSIVLTYLMTDIARKLSWGSELTVQKLAFAAVLHDIDLDEDLFVAKQALLQEGDLKEMSETPELKRILEHPLKAATLVLNWPLCPPDVDIIIRQHHEKPDGSGFPSGLKRTQISPLSALFILSEDIVYHSIENFGVLPKDYLISKKNFYNSEPFRDIANAALEVLDIN